MSIRFTKAIRLTSRQEYQKFSHSAHRKLGKWILIEVRESHTPHTRLGITVTRRYGDAHQRNRFKRIVREAFRLCYSQLRQGYDLNIKPRTEAKTAKSQDIMVELLSLLT